MVPIASVSITAAPVIPAKKTLAIIFAWANPPRTFPTRILENFTNRPVIPVRFMISPARMKNGMAMRVSISNPLKNWSGAMVNMATSFAIMYIPTRLATPMVNPIGIPNKRSVAKTMIIDKNIRVSLFRCR